MVTKNSIVYVHVHTNVILNSRYLVDRVEYGLLKFVGEVSQHLHSGGDSLSHWLVFQGLVIGYIIGQLTVGGGAWGGASNQVI